MTREGRVLCWPASRLGEAVSVLARKGGMRPRDAELPAVARRALHEPTGAALGAWLEGASNWLGLEAEGVEVPYAEVERLVRSGGPALFQVRSGAGFRFVLVLRADWRSVTVLAPDLTTRRIPAERLRAVLCQRIEAPVAAEVERLLEAAGVPRRRRARARAAMLRERLAEARIGGCWILRLPPGASFLRQFWLARLPHRVALMLAVHVVQYGLGLLSWYMIGKGALEGRLDAGLLLAWALVLLTLIPFRLLAARASGLLAIDGGALIKQRLLAGSLNLDPDAVRHQGAGQLLGRVIESQAVESLSVGGGLTGLLALIELVMAGSVLAVGAAGTPQVLLLVAWSVLGVVVGVWHYRRRRSWTDARLALTHDLVERMVGHRTRLAQEARERWHDGEDQVLDRYVLASRDADRAAAVFAALMARGWLVVAIVGMAPAFASGRASTGALAVSMGGIMLSYGALRRLTMSLASLTGAAIAWRQIGPLFRAAVATERPASPAFALAVRGPERRVREGQPVIEAHDLSFRYGSRPKPVLQGVNLRICAGDRLLVEGPSGGGKSTLGALLAGLRVPESGLLLLDGLDRRTLGAEAWRRRVVAAPQFHENHVLSSTLGFNLLMGRRWPATDEDLAEAERICRELELGPLLEKMPSGLQQMVGETGWQLSHGERSRLYIARALLHNADLVVLDESFAALDPETMHRALQCVIARSRSLLVIAHP